MWHILHAKLHRKRDGFLFFYTRVKAFRVNSSSFRQPRDTWQTSHKPVPLTRRKRRQLSIDNGRLFFSSFSFFFHLIAATRRTWNAFTRRPLDASSVSRTSPSHRARMAFGKCDFRRPSVANYTNSNNDSYVDFSQKWEKKRKRERPERERETGESWRICRLCKAAVHVFHFQDFGRAGLMFFISDPWR